MPNKVQEVVSQGTRSIVDDKSYGKELCKNNKTLKKPQLPSKNKPSSALSSAVSTISTITLTEDDKQVNEEYEDSDQVDESIDRKNLHIDKKNCVFTLNYKIYISGKL